MSEETQVTETNGASAAETPPQIFKETVAPQTAKPDVVADTRKKLADVAKAEADKLAARRREQQLFSDEQRQRVAAEAKLREAEERNKQLSAQLEMDPLEMLEKRGITPRQLGERILKRGTPEAAVEEALARAKAAEEGLQKMRQEATDRESKALQEQRFRGAQKALHDLFDANKSSLPFLSRVATAPGRLEAEYMAIYNAVQADPEARQHTFSDLEYLQAVEASKRADAEAYLDALEEKALEEHLTKRRGSAQSKAETTRASTPQDKERAPGKPAPKTLAPSLGRSQSWKPADWDKLSDKKQNAILAERLTQGLPITD